MGILIIIVCNEWIEEVCAFIGNKTYTYTLNAYNMKNIRNAHGSINLHKLRLQLSNK